MNPTSKTLPFIAVLGAASLLAIPVALAQAPRSGGDDWPARPVRFIVPFAPGAANDLIARAVGSKLADIWGQSVLVDNRPGGGTVIGSDLVARSPADGYTLLQIGLAHAVNPSVIAKLPYDSLRDFTMVAQTGESPFVMVSNVSLPVKNVRELVAMAKAKPGTLAYGSTGSGGTSHLMGELLKSMAGIDVIHVPYKGLSPALTEVIGGQIQYSFETMTAATPHVKNGRVVAIAQTRTKRAKGHPNVPTMQEEGFDGFEATTWYGLAGPGKLSAGITNKINRDVNTILAMPDVQEKLETYGAEDGGGTPEKFAQFIRSEQEKWARVVKDANVKIEA